MDHGQGRALAPRPPAPPQLKAPPDENKKRKRASIACKPCRERKTACNSVRPVCSACETRQTECYYLTKDESETKLQALRRENKGLNDLIEHLRTMPEDAAHSALMQLRDSGNPLSILKDIEDGSLSMVQPSQKATALAALPAVHSDTNFKLMIDHSTAYPALNLTRDAILAKSTLLDSAKVLAYDLPPGATSKTSGSQSFGDPEDIFKAQEVPNVEVDGASPHSVDPLLKNLNIGFWTTVAVSNHLAANAVSLYLENDHPVLGLFDAQLFLKDFIELRQDFCSPLLVNSLLAFACQAYTSKDPDASAKSYEFEKEAELLWRAENRDSLLTTAGLMLLFLSHAGHASQKEIEFLQEASEMAKRLKLFGVKNALSEKEIKSLSFQAQLALSHTSWGLFNLYTSQAQYYLCDPTSLYPKVPMPRGPDMRDLEKAQGYMQSENMLPSHDTGQVFHYLCKLSVISAQILLVIRDNSGSKTPPPLAFALSKYGQLMDLMDSVPEGMKRRAGADSAQVLDFHIAFHAIIMDLFRPFITSEKEALQQSSQKYNSPEAFFAASVHQLKGIIIEYTSQHPAAAHHMYWHTALLYVFNVIIKDPTDPHWRFYFWLCFHCYSKLYVCYPVMECFVQSLLAIAVKYGAITRKDAARVMQERFYTEGAGKRARTRRGGPKEKQRSTYMMDLDAAVRDRDVADVSALVAKFEDMDMFDEFTRMGESGSSEDGSDIFMGPQPSG